MESGPFSSDDKVIQAMNKFVVVSLYTDAGARQTEFARLREELAHSTTNPVYVLVNPFTNEILATFDFNQAMKPDFADKIEKAWRRFRSQLRRNGVGG